jgi:glycosyltransferase involved in cell wall biosynthesis
MSTGAADRAGAMPVAPRRRLVLLIAEYAYFLSHRLDLARALAAAGFDVTVVTRVPGGITVPAWPGIAVRHLDIARGSGQPLRDLLALIRLTALLRSLRPAILHNVSVKLVLLGSLAAWLARVPSVLNGFTGLGALFHGGGPRLRGLRAVVVPVLGWVVRRTGAWSLFQNPEDEAAMVRLGLAAPAHSALVCGAGVDVTALRPAPEPDGVPVVLFVGRLLLDKGLAEFVTAACRLRDAGVEARFQVAGGTDPQNPRAVPPETLADWRREAPVEWLGHVPDMAGLYARCHIVCLPSYHEGVPKVLLEAAACGRPAVATDIAGCRRVVEPGRSGLLVPPRDATALAAALAELIRRPDLRRAFGDRARALAESTFAAPLINQEIVGLCRRMSET